jgi:hypothetical protein
MLEVDPAEELRRDLERRERERVTARLALGVR